MIYPVARNRKLATLLLSCSFEICPLLHSFFSLLCMTTKSKFQKENDLEFMVLYTGHAFSVTLWLRM